MKDSNYTRVCIYEGANILNFHHMFVNISYHRYQDIKNQSGYPAMSISIATCLSHYTNYIYITSTRYNNMHIISNIIKNLALTISYEIYKMFNNKFSGKLTNFCVNF